MTPLQELAAWLKRQDAVPEAWLEALAGAAEEAPHTPETAIAEALAKGIGTDRSRSERNAVYRAVRNYVVNELGLSESAVMTKITGRIDEIFASPRWTNLIERGIALRVEAFCRDRLTGMTLDSVKSALAANYDVKVTRKEGT